ncbi:MAG: filamentous hemagglutinin family protein [Methylococcaceae bacterium]|nr:filamentous hemagglutinin family protein [Methylococcaceae bacterium]MDZ4157847.1 filamentous hemagglutinin family protein [Methylococcales bacterium]MDP2392352.1 filamentous hemagglutinin family protein [Methylococcaceae bacterium]MDP3021246.1 filamentous hemagglutinin family protein [Methylococcaceae bacterium]MDP3389796.1 filamentous hemagglutinin family protein [Methylococcaceae bacterium]
MVSHRLPVAQLPIIHLNPLAATIRALIAGGFVVGAGVTPVKAESPLPVPTNIDALTTAGQATAAVAGNAMTINQITSKATLDWKSFNIDKGYSVEFKQPSATSVALNNIHQNDASKIFGSLTANGQVYLVNQNGFLFGKDSQVNVNALVASTLDISQADFDAGITKVFDLNKNTNNFATSAAALKGNGEIFLKNNQGQFVLDQQGNKIKIQIFVEQGASIKTHGDGGRVILAAPSITNAGTIETPDGQTILAAATDKVYLQEASDDPDVRGLLVEVGTGGDVNNVGKIIAERGNASLIGFAVNQKGIASATTSVQLNGSVRLLAREGIQAPASVSGKLLGASTKRNTALNDDLGTSATVTLSDGSRTSVDLDSNKTLTAIDAQEQPDSKIEISGHKVLLRKGSLVEAKSGNVDVQALDNPANPTQKGTARIFLEDGAKIDVSGVKNVVQTADSNILEVELRKNELRDAPLQRDGVLFTETVKVDIRDANLVYDDNGKLVSASIPVADVKGAVDRIARNIDARSTDGGSINLKSSGDVVTQAGSTLDFSGGSVAYQAGFITTSKLISGTQLFDIADADPNRQYDRLFDDQRFSAAYVEGKAGGQLQINVYEAILEGNLNGQTINGQLQRLPSQWAADSSVLIDLINGNNFGKQDVKFDTQAVMHALGPFDPIPRKSSAPSEAIALNLNPATLRNSGVRKLTVRTNGDLMLSEGTRVDLPAGGLLDLTARNFNVQGSIVTPSGTVNLRPVVLDSIILPSAITLGSKALIDVSGLWVNDGLDIQQGRALSPVSIQGGTVNLLSEQGDLTLAAGSRILANGGAWRKANTRVEAGEGGSISLRAQTHLAGVEPASLILNGAVAAWGLQQGGSLTLESNEIVIGSAADLPTRSGTAQALLLTPGFFQQGGFADFDLIANHYGLKVANNVQLNLQQANRQLTSAASTAATGSNLLNFSNVVKLPDYLRKPVNLTLSYAEMNAHRPEESLSLGAGALIQTDVGGKVTLNSSTSIFVEGGIITPAGKIALNITVPPVVVGFSDSQGIWLGANSRLLAQGAFVQTPNNLGLISGEVLDGGTVSLEAKRGYIVSRAGSKIDVSGTAANLNVAELRDGRRVQPLRQVASNGGSINLIAGEGMLLDGGLKATAGGASAAGGSLQVSLDRDLRSKPDLPIIGSLFPDNRNPNQPYRIEVSADGSPSIPANLVTGGLINPALFGGKALLNSQTLNQAGFAALTLKTDTARVAGQINSGVLFKGDVQLNATRQIVVDTPSVQSDGGKVVLNSAYVALGSAQSRIGDQLAPNASTGAGQFVAHAQGLELIGGLAFNGFNDIQLLSTGDVRLRGLLGVTQKDFLGQLKVAGDLTIQANQLYPGTLTDFTIDAGNHTVTFLNSPGTAAPVFSAGGSLTVNAANIYQRGTLKAPFGSINLNATDTLQLANGSLTSVSANGLVIPFGRGSGGTDWLYPLDASQNNNIVIDAPPAKNLQLSGKDVDLQAGAKIDLSGGGDLYAYEFIPGPGGSNDVLSAGSGSFAVIPGSNSVLTPFDPLESVGSGVQNGDSVYLNGGGGLAAGWYTLLPARYALLPGAYLLTPQAGSQDQIQNTTNLAGSAVVAGRFGVAGTAISDSRTQGFVVEPGGIVRTRSQFIDYFANDFFANKAEKAGETAPQLPRDAGSLVLSAQTRLKLAADLLATPATLGLGGQVDITGNKLAVVANSADLANLASGTVGLLAEDLNNFDAPSLLLGGKRSKAAQGQRVTVSSSTISVAENVQLSGAEIILAASEQLQVKAGALIESTGKTTVAGGNLMVANQSGGSDGALLRVSSAGQVSVNRDQTVTGNKGELIVEAGATIRALGSTLLDASKNTVFDGDIDMNGGSLALNSSRISIGAAPANTPGLVLSNTNFTLDELQLNSKGDFDIYGGVDFNANQLLISAANINGSDNAGQTASIHADLITLTNLAANSNRNGTGSGTLNLEAREIRLGSGSYGISGFETVNFTAAQGLNGIGQIFDPVTGSSSFAVPGQLTVAADLNLNAAYISGGSGATTAIDASGHQVNLTALGDEPVNAAVGLGVSWSLTGDAINGTGRFLLPSGILNLQANNGDLALQDGSLIDVSGRAVAFADAVKYSAGGTVNLKAVNGNIGLAEDADIRLGGAKSIAADQQASDAGQLTVAAAQGRFNWLGSIDGKGAAVTDSSLRQASLKLDVDTLGDVSALSQQLNQASFNQDLSLRQRQGDFTLANGDSLNARQISIAADQGKVVVNGILNVSGAKAGEVEVYGHDGITLGATGQILAKGTATGADGGKVLLDTVHRDDSGSGLLDLSAAGGLIDVSGGQDGNGGAVHLRSGRDGNDVNVSAINSTVQGADPLRSALEATRVYDNISTITSSLINSWNSDTANFMNNRPTLSGSAAGLFEILPGIEVRSSGNLTLADDWDFMSGVWSEADAAWDSEWRYLDAQGNKALPGFLTLRAIGDLNINASINDAFADTPLPGQALIDPSFASDFLSQDLLQPGLSWSYRLVAGDNVNLAHSHTGEQVKVRTGTGAIDINAGGNITFVANPGNAQAAAAVYTMGTTAQYTRSQLLNGEIPGIPAQNNGETLQTYLARLGAEQLDQLLRYGLLDELELAIGGGLLAEFPTRGGDIRLTAGVNIAGIQTGQQTSDWLVRAGQWQAGSNNNKATAWGINVSGDRNFDNIDVNDNGNVVFSSGNRFFNQNVGALGGGNVTVQAGGNVTNLSVMIPTTGKPLGIINADGQWLQNGTVINGGGDLRVVAGNDIVGGEFYTGQGSAALIAGGSIAQGTIPGSTQKIGVLLDVGDAVFDVQARRDIHLATALSPTILKQKVLGDLGSNVDSRFFSFTGDSAVNLQSTAGNLLFDNDLDAVKRLKGVSSNDGSGFEYLVYPATVRGTALSGDVRINGSMTLFPDANGELQLLANGNIGSDLAANSGKKISVNMSDADPALLPGLANPARSLDGSFVSGILLARERLDANSPQPLTIHAPVPVHQGHVSRPLIVANNGSISFDAGLEATFHLPQASSFIAGKDINNLSINGQNLSPEDATLIMAGGNINFDTNVDSNGNVVFTKNNPQFFRVSGPGQLQLIAGKDVVLGSSGGIQTVGNVLNPALPADGASVSVLAGVSGGIDLAGFIQRYQTSYPSILQGLAGLSESEQRQRLGLVLQVFFAELEASAKAAAATPEGQRGAAYQRGKDAIAALFPGEDYQGDISLVFSAIKTLAGGDINLLVPGGKLDVGLTGKKAADELGIVVQQAGDLNIFTEGNINVNQSRVFTLGGGNILAWSSKGDIDAGKGAKSTLSAPRPITFIDDKGNITTIFPPIISGNGIQAIGGGDVTLAALEGVVDAGEAGISGGNITIAATAVIGASNIQASGSTTGVPVTVSAPVTVAGADSAAASAAKTATQSNDKDDDNTDGKNQKDKKTTVSILSADVVGFGDCSVGDVKDAKAGCGGGV